MGHLAFLVKKSWQKNCKKSNFAFLAFLLSFWIFQVDVANFVAIIKLSTIGNRSAQQEFSISTKVLNKWHLTLGCDVKDDSI